METVSRRTALVAGAAFLGLGGTANAEAADLRFEITKNRRGEFLWRLKAANNKIIATSGEGYNAKAGCRLAIERIMNGAATATIQDLT